MCGTLTANLDLILDTTYLGSVNIDNDAIFAAFDCNCPVSFSVEADYDGVTAGDVYGQLDVRNSVYEIVQITDSCIKTLPM